MVPIALDSVSLSKMRRFERKAYRYMDLYRQRDGRRLTAAQVEWSVKKFTSHRRISDFIFKEEDGVCKGLMPRPKTAEEIAAANAEKAARAAARALVQPVVVADAVVDNMEVVVDVVVVVDPVVVATLVHHAT